MDVSHPQDKENDLFSGQKKSTKVFKRICVGKQRRSHIKAAQRPAEEGVGRHMEGVFRMGTSY